MKNIWTKVRGCLLLLNHGLKAVVYAPLGNRALALKCFDNNPMQ